MSFSPECRDLLKRRHSQDELHRDMTGTTDFEVHHAVQNGDIERVEALLKENPDKIGQTNLLGQTPLHLATVEGHGDIVYFLLNMGANPHAKNSLGKTPLMRAVDRNRVNIARTLLEFGADVNTRADNGSTAYTLAVKQNNAELIDLFKPYLDSDDEEEVPNDDKKSPPKLAAFHLANSTSAKGDGAGDDFVGFNNSNYHSRGRGGHNKNRLSVEINQDDLAALIAEVQAAEVDETGGSSDEDNIPIPDILGDKDEPPHSATSQASVEWETIDETVVPDRRLEPEISEKDEEFVGFQNDQSTYSAERSLPTMRRKTSLKRRSPGVFGSDGRSPGSDPPSPDMPGPDVPVEEEFVGFNNPQSTYSAERASAPTTSGSVEEEMESRSRMRVRVLSVADSSNPSASLGSLGGGRLPGASLGGDSMGEARSNPSRSSGVLSAEEIADILADGEEKKKDLGLVYSDSDDTPVGSPVVNRVKADDLIINPAGRGEGGGKSSNSEGKTDTIEGYQSPSMADLSRRKSFRKSSIGADAETKSLTSILLVRTTGGDANPMSDDGEFVGFNNDGSSYAAQRESERRASQQHVNEDQWSD